MEGRTRFPDKSEKVLRCDAAVGKGAEVVPEGGGLERRYRGERTHGFRNETVPAQRPFEAEV